MCLISLTLRSAPGSVPSSFSISGNVDGCIEIGYVGSDEMFNLYVVPLLERLVLK